MVVRVPPPRGPNTPSLATPFSIYNFWDLKTFFGTENF